MTITRCVLGLALTIVLSALVPGQSVSKTIAVAGKALGGAKALRGVTSKQVTGTITRISDGKSGRYSSTVSTPNLYSEKYDIGGYEFAAGYNGKSGWVRDSKTGLSTITGDAARDFQAEAAYRNSAWLNAKSEKAKIASGRSPDEVTITTAKGALIKLFFDPATGLPVREELRRGESVRTFDYSDYRAIGSVKMPFAVRQTIDGEVYEIILDEIKLNQRVDRFAFDFPKVSNEPIPDIAKLLSEVRANADRIEELLENYSYNETRIDRELDKNGNLVEKGSETHTLTFYKGHRITRTIEKNGKPLSPADQENEDRDAQKQVAEIEKKIAEKAGKTGDQNTSDENRRITIAEALKGSLLLNPRRERFASRDVIVFDYEPDPNFKPQTRNEKLFALCSGAVWVDPIKNQVVRLEATLSKSAGNFLAKAKRGASFTLENELVNNEIWLPSRADINVQIKILFAGININNVIKYGNYRRFHTDVKEVKVGEEQQP